ncbi:Nitronate monooxygenase [Hondaea fermentalgiana]|uniref:Nitronate monooxygenase n=1 Tax=Hondaea fermentalgiana TaxID=2315210 RepID=A0A2R5GJ14_9STRA|nr:Nitronate monooxygenase [Hondaea fermentalgiana]|eukprot:GBG30882.1 Nitronate monooxygenase [Hondaea fermentalgiana]
MAGKQVFKTALTELTGVRHPVMLGGMHYVGYAGLAAAVSNAGGLGVITALTQTSPEDLRAEIRKTKELTDKPFGVNMTLLPMLKPPNYDAYAHVVVEEGIRVVETAGHYKGLEPFVKLFKDNGMSIIHKCTSTRHAKTAERMGVDMVSIDGFEAAGHPGETDVGGWVLFAKAQQDLSIPWLACGGMGTGGQLAAALNLGAQGVAMGSRFMATKEAAIHDNIKKAIVEGDESSTTLIMRSMRNTERVYKNETAMRILETEREHPGEFDRIRDYVRGAAYKRAFQETGDINEGVWSLGQVTALIHDIPTCEDLIEGLVNDAAACLRKTSSMMVEN